VPANAMMLLPRRSDRDDIEGRAVALAVSRPQGGGKEPIVAPAMKINLFTRGNR
jgi:hypothetical protein